MNLVGMIKYIYDVARLMHIQRNECHKRNNASRRRATHRMQSRARTSRISEVRASPPGEKKNGATLHLNGIVSRNSKAARHAVRNEV